MGRGRQKAKQTKVARELKYYTQETNFTELERELRGDTGEAVTPPTPGDDDYDDRYAAWADLAYGDDDLDEDDDGDEESYDQAP